MELLWTVKNKSRIVQLYSASAGFAITTKSLKGCPTLESRNVSQWFFFWAALIDFFTLRLKKKNETENVELDFFSIKCSLSYFHVSGIVKQIFIEFRLLGDTK